MTAKVAVIFEIGSGRIAELMREREIKNIPELKEVIEYMTVEEIDDISDKYGVESVEVEE